MTNFTLYDGLKDYYENRWSLLLMKMDLLIHLDAARKDKYPLPKCLDNHIAKELPPYISYVGYLTKPTLKEMFKRRGLPYYADKYPSTVLEVLSQQLQAAQYLNFTYALPVFQEELSNYMSVAEDCMTLEASMVHFYKSNSSKLGDLLKDQQFSATAHSSATGGLLRALKHKLMESNHALSTTIGHN